MSTNGMNSPIGSHAGTHGKVLSALSTLHDSGSTTEDARAADEYLRLVRANPSLAVPAGAAILQQEALSDPAVFQFAATALADHAAVAPDEVRSIVLSNFEKLVHGVTSVPVYRSLCKAGVWGVARMNDDRDFESHYAQLRQVAKTGHVVFLMDQALAEECELLVRANPNLHELVHRRCRPFANAATQAATEALFDSRRSDSLRREAVAGLCLWKVYVPAATAAVLDPLVRALGAGIAPIDVAVGISEVVEWLLSGGAGQVDPWVLQKLFAALRCMVEDTLTNGGEKASHGTVGHAVSEICASIADSAADALLSSDRAAMGGRSALEEHVQLMLCCLRSNDSMTFQASLAAWDVWLAASSDQDSDFVSVVAAVVPGVVKCILHHLRALHARALNDNTAIEAFDNDSEYALDHLKALALDTLHHAAQCMTIAHYVRMLIDDQADETMLFALSAAGDVSCTDDDARVVAGLVSRVLSLTYARTNSVPIRRCAFRTLAAYAPVLTSGHVSEAVLQGVLDSACGSLADLGVEPSLLLREACEAHPGRFVGHLPTIVAKVAEALGSSSVLMLRLPHADDVESGELTAAEMVVHAVAQVAAELPKRATRYEAVARVLEAPLSRMRHEPKMDGVSEAVRDVRLVAVAVRAVNDCGVAASLLETVSPFVQSAAARGAAEMSLAGAVCLLLETCNAPTLLDPDESTTRAEGVSEAPASMLLPSIALTSEAFSRSGPRGEACWLTTTSRLCARALTGATAVDAQPVVFNAVQRSVESVHSFTAHDGIHTRPDMLQGVLSLVVSVMRHDSAGSQLVQHPLVDACARIARQPMRNDETGIVVEAIAFWHALVFRVDASRLQAILDSAKCTRPQLGDQLLLAACSLRATRKSVVLAADALFPVLAAAGVHLPLEWMTAGPVERDCVRAALLSAITADNGIEFRRAVLNVRRLTRHDIDIETFRASCGGQQ